MNTTYAHDWELQNYNIFLSNHTKMHSGQMYMQCVYKLKHIV